MVNTVIRIVVAGLVGTGLTFILVTGIVGILLVSFSCINADVDQKHSGPGGSSGWAAGMLMLLFLLSIVLASPLIFEIVSLPSMAFAGALAVRMSPGKVTAPVGERFVVPAATGAVMGSLKTIVYIVIGVSLVYWYRDTSIIQHMFTEHVSVTIINVGRLVQALLVIAYFEVFVAIICSMIGAYVDS